jgi:hypothetical protein
VDSPSSPTSARGASRSTTEPILSSETVSVLLD